VADELTTTIISPQVVAAGGVLAGALQSTSPGAGNFYLLMEQYSDELAFIPGSRAYLHQEATGVYINSTTLYTTRTWAAIGVVEDVTVLLTLPNSDCLLYIFLKERHSNVVAGSFAVGTMYEIMAIGTTDFTAIGAASNAIGVIFTATGAGAGTGIAAELPDPDSDDTVDYVAITILSTAPTAATLAGIDLGEIVNLMITMMIVVMMMKMIGGMMTGVK